MKQVNIKIVTLKMSGEMFCSEIAGALMAMTTTIFDLHADGVPLEGNELQAAIDSYAIKHLQALVDRNRLQVVRPETTAKGDE